MANVEREAADAIRQELQREINAKEAERAALEEQHGQVWDTEELSRDFEVVGFAAPYVVVRRLSDGKTGSLMFQHRPRFYFGWREDQ